MVYYADYYPFGSTSRSGGIESRYGHQGEFAEKDEETGWNNFYLRNYDPAIGRWLTTDPYRQYYSPYVGMGNNPISKIDPDGGKGKDWYLPIGGRVRWKRFGLKAAVKLMDILGLEEKIIPSAIFPLVKCL